MHLCNRSATDLSDIKEGINCARIGFKIPPERKKKFRKVERKFTLKMG